MLSRTRQLRIIKTKELSAKNKTDIVKRDEYNVFLGEAGHKYSIVGLGHAI